MPVCDHCGATTVSTNICTLCASGRQPRGQEPVDWKNTQIVNYAVRRTRPGPRKSGWVKQDFHRAEIGCVLFAVVEDESNGRLIGHATKADGNHRKLVQHAEQQWWDDSRNITGLKSIAQEPKLIRLEFEVTDDFCGDACRNRFRELRTHVPGSKIPAYVFIIRSQTHYEILPTGEVQFLSEWAF